VSRSRYVYVVVSTDDGQPIAGFTVKHELETWLSKNKTTWMKVWRIRDNGTHTEHTVTDYPKEDGGKNK